MTVIAILAGFICISLAIVLIEETTVSPFDDESTPIEHWARDTAARRGLTDTQTTKLLISLRKAGFKRWDRYRWEEIDQLVDGVMNETPQP